MTQSVASPTQETQITASQVLGEPAPATKVEEPVAPKADEKVSSKLQMLIGREKTALQRERDAKAKETELAEKIKAFSEREARLQEFETLKQTNPMKALELLGLSYQDLTQIALADGNITPEIQIKKVKDELDSFRKQTETERLQKAEEEKRHEEAKQAKTLETFKGEIASYLKENLQRYELIEFEQSQELVFDVIDEHFERTKDPETQMGEVMTIAQAADKVEAYLEQKYDKARNLHKVKTLLAPRPEQKEAKTQPLQSQKTKTLNNNLSATPAPRRTAPISDEERIAKAIAYAKGLRP